MSALAAGGAGGSGGAASPSLAPPNSFSQGAWLALWLPCVVFAHVFAGLWLLAALLKLRPETGLALRAGLAALARCCTGRRPGSRRGAGAANKKLEEPERAPGSGAAPLLPGLELGPAAAAQQALLANNGPASVAAATATQATAGPSEHAGAPLCPAAPTAVPTPAALHAALPGAPNAVPRRWTALGLPAADVASAVAAAPAFAAPASPPAAAAAAAPSTVARRTATVHPTGSRTPAAALWGAGTEGGSGRVSHYRCATEEHARAPAGLNTPACPVNACDSAL
jgi:hypothetical protein